jgi:predicted transcriptional regulator
LNIPPKARYKAMLPAIPVTDETRNRVRDIANAHDASMASVLRAAIDLFLQSGDKIFIADDKLKGKQ